MIFLSKKVLLVLISSAIGYFALNVVFAMDEKGRGGGEKPPALKETPNLLRFPLRLLGKNRQLAYLGRPDEEDARVPHNLELPHEDEEDARVPHNPNFGLPDEEEACVPHNLELPHRDEKDACVPNLNLPCEK